MPTKEIVCLAYSRKDGGRCLAGIDLATRRWIRAIGAYENGALADNDCFMLDEAGAFVLPRILDVIEINFLGAEPNRAQPENWKISGSQFKLLRPVGIAESTLLRQSLTDDPEIFRGYERSITRQEIESRPPNNSLALVRPSALRWRPEKDGYGRMRFRGTFDISGATYALPLTDDDYTSKLARQEEPEWINGLSNTSTDLLLTISLGDLFHDCHYKLIAGVFELPIAAI
jgi:hypothetical protein